MVYTIHVYVYMKSHHLWIHITAYAKECDRYCHAHVSQAVKNKEEQVLAIEDS